MINIEGLYETAAERLEETLTTRIFQKKERSCELEATYDVILNDNVILKSSGDTVILDLGAKKEYLSTDDFIEVHIT